MAMMISQTQLSSNRLQKQLFIVIPPYDKIYREGGEVARALLLSSYAENGEG